MLLDEDLAAFDLSLTELLGVLSAAEHSLAIAKLRLEQQGLDEEMREPNAATKRYLGWA